MLSAVIDSMQAIGYVGVLNAQKNNTFTGPGGGEAAIQSNSPLQIIIIKG